MKIRSPDRKRIDHLDSNAVVESYDYDPNGNRTASTVDYGTPVARTYAYNADDQLTAINGDEVEYSYDLDGFLTERRRDTGSTVEVTGYVYNTRGELLSVDLPAGGAVERVEYTYDPLGRRIARRAYDHEETILSTEKYLWKGLTDLLAVYDGSNQLQQRFEYLGGGLPVGVEIWDGTGFDYYYLAYDQIGSLRYVFDESGSVAKAISYDAFGNVLSDSSPSLKLPLGFAGGHTDQDTGLVRFVARDYDPEIGRWTAGDPIGIQGDPNNLGNGYAYVGNRPWTGLDPMGLGWTTWATGLGYESSDTEFWWGFYESLHDNSRAIMHPTAPDAADNNALGQAWNTRHKNPYLSYLALGGYGTAVVAASSAGGLIVYETIGGTGFAIGGEFVENGISNGGHEPQIPPTPGNVEQCPSSAPGEAPSQPPLTPLEPASESVPNAPRRFSGNYEGGQRAYRENVPRDKYNNPVPEPEANGPHTRLQRDKVDPTRIYSATEFDSEGQAVRRTDFAGRPGDPLPHVHEYNSETQSFDRRKDPLK